MHIKKKIHKYFPIFLKLWKAKLTHSAVTEYIRLYLLLQIYW